MSSIRTRIANRFALLILTAVAIFAGTVYAARRAGALSDMERLARQRANIVLQILASAGSGSFSFDERAPEDPVSGTVQGLGAVGMLKNFLDAQPGYLLVWSPDGREVYRSASVRALAAYLQGDQVTELARADNQAFSQWVSEARSRLEPVPYALRADNGILVGVRSERGFVAVVGVSADELPTSWREILGSALVSLPFVVLLAVLGAYMLAGNVLAPVDRMRQEVEAITDGRSLHKRLNVEGDDEMARLTSTLNAMIGRLETSFGALRRFTADASHELKTPLTVLRADVERAMSVPPHSTEQLVALEEALQETARMAALVDSLLTLARADEGRFDLHREPVDLQEIAREVYETGLMLGESGGHHVTMPHAEPAIVLGDRLRLRQLFMNLVENAIKYTPAGGAVQLNLTVEGNSAHFTVRDSGIGISAADLPHVFERFWRADRARTRATQHSSNGLGLAICQWIAQAHGGALTVQSRLHRGSTFAAVLPLATPADPQVAETAAAVGA